MNTEKKLTKIRAKCVELLEDSKKYGKVSLGKETGAAESGWRDTIVVIDWLEAMPTQVMEAIAMEIIASWEGLV